jgi:hypothetical protein
VDANTYQNAINKGAKLLCLFPKSQGADAQAANGGTILEAAEYLQTDVLSATEGWTSVGNQIDEADINILTEAFAGLKITGQNVVDVNWVQDKSGFIYSNPAAPDLAEGQTGIVG